MPLHFLGESEKIKFSFIAGFFVALVFALIVLFFIFSFVSFGGDENVSLGVEQNFSAGNFSLNSSLELEDMGNESFNVSIENVSVGDNFSEEVDVVLKNFSLLINFSEELVLLESKGDKLNLNESIVDVFDDKLTDYDLGVFLKMFYVGEKKCWQRVLISDGLVLSEFSDDDYLDGEETVGFRIVKGSEILSYVLEFDDGVLMEDLVGESIFILGSEYFVSDVVKNEIGLFENFNVFTLKENEVVNLNFGNVSSNISISYLNDDIVVLVIDGDVSDYLGVGDVVLLGNFWVRVKDLFYSERNSNSGIELVVSPRRIVLTDGVFEDSGVDYDNVDVSFEFVDDYLEEIIISWSADGDEFLVSDGKLVFPFFENLKVHMGDKGIDEEDEYYWTVSVNAFSEEFWWS